MAERLKEQINPPHLPLSTRRASAIHASQTRAHPPASPHYVGHDAGNHPEDAPSLTQDRSRRAIQPQAYDEEGDDDRYPQRPPSSARRYIHPREEAYTQGNRQIIVHREPPIRRRFHWMIFMGMVMFVMVLGWFLFTALGYWFQQKQDDWKYGAPFRTYQVDQYVAMGDTPQNPDHFLALNIRGSIEIVQLNTASPKYDHVYPITTVNDSSIPVFLSFEDTNHDGKLDMLVTIGDSNSYTVILLNNGTQFTH